MTCKTDKAAVLHCENSRTMAMVPVIIVIVSWASVNTCAVLLCAPFERKQHNLKGARVNEGFTQWSSCCMQAATEATCASRHHIAPYICREDGLCSPLCSKAALQVLQLISPGYISFTNFTWMLNTHYSLKTSPLPVLLAPSMPMFPMTSREGTLSLCQVLM